MKKIKNGFTLVEILIVIAILGILATMVLTNVGTAREQARIAVAKAEAREIYNAFVLLESDTSEWPGHKTPFETEQGAGGNELCPDGCTYSLSDPEAGLTATDGNYPGWDGPYLSDIPKDPWGNEYFFDTDYDIDPTAGEEWVATIGSYGPNGVGNNLYDNDDILYVIKK